MTQPTIDTLAYRGDAIEWASELADTYGDDALRAATAMLRVAQAGQIAEHIEMSEQVVAILSRDGYAFLPWASAAAQTPAAGKASSHSR